ncbi:MAG: DUF4845 domain-containing protein [Ketobacteraceae bacterium]|nr:DUF4845 domain-containing protein [Ketobacteraceae bacterium]
MKNPAKQAGMTTTGMVIIGGMVAFLAISVIKLYPSYYDDFAVATALKNMEDEERKAATMTPKEIRESLNRRLQVSNVRLEKDQVEILKEDGVIKLNVNYEVRTHMYGNIDAITSFSHSIELSP